MDKMVLSHEVKVMYSHCFAVFVYVCVCLRVCVCVCVCLCVCQNARMTSQAQVGRSDLCAARSQNKGTLLSQFCNVYDMFYFAP